MIFRWSAGKFRCFAESFVKNKGNKGDLQWLLEKVLDESQVSKVKAGLERLATTDKSQSLTKNIKDFKHEIQKARCAGRTWKEIANIFNEAGVRVSESLLATECSDKRKKVQTKQTISKEKSQKVSVKPQTQQTPPPVFGSGASFQIRPDRGDDL